MKPKDERMLLNLCNQINRVDDSLGARSDHEGGNVGPTYSIFTTADAEMFEDIASAQISDHQEAMRLWSKLRRLYRRVNKS